MSRIGALLSVALLTCTTTYQSEFHRVERRGPTTQVPERLDRGAPFVKCHLADGSVYVLSEWELSPDETRLRGRGVRYDFERRAVERGQLEVSLDRVLVLETNRPHRFARTNLIVMGVASGLSFVVTVACMSNPKACFGSCPTFYVHDGKRFVLAAEGFSASMARALEDTDVDALPNAHPNGSRVAVWVTNEALETHAIRSVSLLAARRPRGARVYRAGARYLIASRPSPPVECRSQGGDCTARYAVDDGDEYFSQTDGKDLAARETVDLVFAERPRRAGLVVTGRNTLLSTFLFYQVLAYLGRSAGAGFALLEQSSALLASVRAAQKLLGDVEIEARDRDGGWVPIGSFDEVGPIARDAAAFELPEGLPERNLVVRLRMTRGNFRIDRVHLVSIDGESRPLRLAPVIARSEGALDADAIARLADSGDYLVTYPGDSYELEFELPSGGPYELFLESRGYYYEWIREQWLRDESPRAVAELLTNPAQTFRRLAPAFKALEPDMERIFWASRVDVRMRPPEEAE